MKAQGNALGYRPEKRPKALKERDGADEDVALSGLPRIERFITQGCALGYHIVPFQGTPCYLINSCVGSDTSPNRFKISSGNSL